MQYNAHILDWLSWKFRCTMVVRRESMIQGLQMLSDPHFLIREPIQRLFPAGFVLPEKWLAKTTLVYPDQENRVVSLGEHYDHESGLTITRTFEIVTPCCEWTGWNNGDGHGKVRIAGKPRYVHRLSWEFANGRALADNEVVDHLCRNRPCWNPTHLEAVTVAINTARGAGRFYQYKRQHEYGE